MTTIQELCCVLLLASVGPVAVDTAEARPPEQTAQPAALLSFHGKDYLHRWSKNGQHEFTPQGQERLDAWQEMITILVKEDVHDGEQLAALANGLHGMYQSKGGILATASKPITVERPAEHLIVAMLVQGDLIETVFARLILIDGTGVIVLYAHRSYGEQSAQHNAQWLQANATSVQQALMAWEGVPAPRMLRQLPHAP